MAKKSGPESIHHVVAIRMRLTGVGSLNLALSSLDDVASATLIPITMAVATSIEPTRLANFQSQRIRLTGQLNVIDEYFQVTRLIFFAKPIAVEYPG